jgi:hypothetical protein
MTGHRTFADGRPTFCNACNLSVVNSFGLAAAYGDGADVFITGDSTREQRQYTAWVGKLSRRLGAAHGAGSGFGRLLSELDGISQVYFADIHGSDAEDAIAERRVASGVPERLRFFSIYNDTEYAAGDHLELLTDFLGFRFDDVAFSFTESDCGNPALMAHLRGLKAERVFQRSYDDGMREYVNFALGLMRKKDYPPQLVELMRGRYEGPGAMERMRKAADDYAMETFGLTEEQLVCMAYSPFAGKGAGLDDFLAREHPDLPVDDARAVLGGSDDPRVAAELERISGLGLSQLRVLYSSPGPDVIQLVLADDPHKAVIETRHSKDGPKTFEQISGR